ncbi:hypothetical protein [uncultured Jatrophihabitans sp.]|uniref:hypothetical protein n=1 Tax=uncultured Jatrophihabitans sp. TaxID=1610747 RepID=UPI0035CBD1E2
MYRVDDVVSGRITPTWALPLLPPLEEEEEDEPPVPLVPDEAGLLVPELLHALRMVTAAAPTATMASALLRIDSRLSKDFGLAPDECCGREHIET